MTARRTILVRAQSPRLRLALVALALVGVLGLVAGGIVYSREQSKDGMLARLAERATTSADFVSTYVSQQAVR